MLRRVLDSLLVQTYPADFFEVIVVDNGSKDETAAVFAKFSKQFPNTRYYFDDRPGLHIGRHVGLNQGRGEILVYTDDDIRAFPSWLAGIAESFEDSQVALVGGKILPEFEIEPPNWVETLWEKTSSGKILTCFSLLDFGEKIQEILPIYVFGCNFSIRKSILEDLNGFHPDGMPEDLVLWRGDGETAVAKAVQERGYKIIYNPKASVFHAVMKNRMTTGYLYSRAFAGGVSWSYTDIRRYGAPRDSAFIEKIKYQGKKLLAYVSCLPAKYFDVMYAIKKGHLDGYYLHSTTARKDPRLMKWITKPNYLEGNL